MRVLIFGASGFVGLPAAQALVRAGHIVYGVTRSEVKARELATEEIIPIVADYADPSPWSHLVSTLDAVVDATSAGKDLEEANLATVAKFAAEGRPSHAPKLAFISSSGTWVHGHNPKEVVGDTTPLGVLNPPTPITAWRLQQEQAVIKNTVLNGIVIRPTVIYGRSGSLTDFMFKPAYEGTIRWFGEPGQRMSVVHQDDLAELYRLVVERSSILGGTIFDAGNDFTESVDDILRKLVQITGAKGPIYSPPSNPREEALSITHLVRPYLAKALVGWQPKKAGLVDYLQIYYDAWKAHNGLA